MAVISGTTGRVSIGGTAAFSTVRNWKIDTKNAVAKGVASNSQAMEFGLPGVSDFSGSFEVYGATPLATVSPGSVYVFYGQTGTHEVMGGIIIDSITVTCNIEAGEMLTYTVNFSSIGSSTAVATANNTALTFATVTSVTNTSVPTAFSATVCKAAWGPVNAGVASAMADISDVRSWSFTITADNKPWVSSNTGGVTKRVAGNLSASMSVSLFQSTYPVFDTNATRLTVGTPGELRLYTTATLFWGFKYPIVSALPMGVEIEGGDPPASEISFEYSGYATISSVYTRGAIIDPNSVTFWG